MTELAAPHVWAAPTRRRTVGGFEEIRARAGSGLTAVLAVSDAVRRRCSAAGYPPELVDVVRQAMPHEAETGGRRSAATGSGPAATSAHRRLPRLGVPAQGPAAAGRGGPAELAPSCGSRSSARFQRPSPSSSARLIGAGSSSSWASSRRTRSAGCCATSTRWRCPRCGGTARRSPPRSVARRGCRCSSRGWAGCRRRSMTVSTGSCSTPSTPTISPAAIERLADEPGLLERLQANIGATATVRRLRRRARGATTRDERPGADRPGGDASPRPTPPSAGRATTDCPQASSIINDRVSERLHGAGPARRPRRRARRDRRSPTPPTSRSATSGHPDSQPAPAGALAAIVPWEFGSVPAAWVEQINRQRRRALGPERVRARRCMCTTASTRERVHVIPNGVDLERCSPR